MPTLTLIDGSGISFRSFYGLPPLLTPEGIPIGAVLGFCNLITKFYEVHRPSHWVIAFDAGKSTFRHDLFTEYKAKRLSPPSELITQFALIKELCQAMNIIGLEQPGVEADDLIASYTYAAQNQGWDILIVSSDKDMAQLVGPKVRLYDPFKQTFLDAQAIEQAWGVPTYLTPDVQALAGDTSDNIPGIPGIGMKTAVKWIQDFGSLENVLRRVQEITPERKRALVVQYADQARLCYQLALLKKDIPLRHSLEDFAYQLPNAPLLEGFLSRHHMDTLKSRLIRKGLLPSSPPPQFVFKGNVEEVLEQGYVALSFSYDDQGMILGAGASWRPSQATYLTLEKLKPILEDPACLKIIHDGKSLLHSFHKVWLTDVGISLDRLPFGPFDDIMILSYIIDGGHVPHDLITLITRTLLRSPPDGKDDQSQGQRAHDIFQAWLTLKKKLRECHSARIYEMVDRPLIPILTQMERTGIEVDIEYLHQLNQEFSQALVGLETKIYALSGKPFMIGSPKQLGEILFEDLGWPSGKKGKSGAYQTSSEVLEAFAAQGKELATLVLQWRQLAKLNSTYTVPLAQQAHPVTHRLHTTYNMVATSTGRLSSLNPNLQNIPIRTEEGRKIRQAFKASEGHVLLSLDYSQIELRLLAHMGDEHRLKQAFHEHKDIHQQTACQLFGCPADKITPDMRRQAKIINFGLIYGMSSFGLSQQLGVSSQRAKNIIDVYFKKYPGIAQYIELCKEKARQKGYVTTLWGRRCFLPHINSRNYGLRSAAERQAINAPLQGTSADLMKRAMIRVAQWLESTGSPIKMLLQVHDELILEVPQDLVDQAIKELTPLMASAASLSVPLEVNAAWGSRWKA